MKKYEQLVGQLKSQAGGGQMTQSTGRIGPVKAM